MKSFIIALCVLLLLITLLTVSELYTFSKASEIYSLLADDSEQSDARAMHLFELNRFWFNISMNAEYVSSARIALASLNACKDEDSALPYRAEARMRIKRMKSALIF